MRRMSEWRRNALFAALSVLVLAIGSCTNDATLRSTINVDRPAGAARIPLAVGLYFSPEFLAFAHRPPVDPKLTWEFRFGEMGADLFDGVFFTAFEDVHFVSARPPLAAGGPPVAAIIEPRVEMAEVRGHIGKWNVELVYLFRLYDRTGGLVMSWRIAGYGAHDASDKFVSTGAPDPALEAALTEVGEKLMQALYGNPEIREWLRTQGADLAGR